MKPKYNPAERTKPAMDMKKALNATAALCSKKEHATADIRRKLRRPPLCPVLRPRQIPLQQMGQTKDSRFPPPKTD